MNDYKELIAKLRFYADTADDPIYGICINSPKVMLHAADAIEQLMKERDAAVADFTRYVKHMEDGRQAFSCEFCNEENCDSCKHCSNFEWRGVKENKYDDF